jgi:beta-glucosidase
MKHFIGYGSTTTGKDRTPIPERILRQYDFMKPQSKRAQKSIMISSGEINGAVHASKHLITDVPKNELGFEGLLSLTERYYIPIHQT